MSRCGMICRANERAPSECNDCPHFFTFPIAAPMALLVCHPLHAAGRKGRHLVDNDVCESPFLSFFLSSFTDHFSAFLKFDSRQHFSCLASFRRWWWINHHVLVLLAELCIVETDPDSFCCSIGLLDHSQSVLMDLPSS